MLENYLNGPNVTIGSLLEKSKCENQRKEEGCWRQRLE